MSVKQVITIIVACTVLGVGSALILGPSPHKPAAECASPPNYGVETDQGPTSPHQCNQGMDVIWTGLMPRFEAVNGNQYFGARTEIGYREDGVMVWRYRADWPEARE